MTDTITLTIDDFEITVPAGTLIVDAAKKVGIDIPVFCYHPKLSSVGMCRMCLVEVGTPNVDRDTGETQRDERGNPIIRWLPNLQTACTMPATEGIVVRTRTERVTRAREAVNEFLLTSHPLDCPVCDKGGECPLQNQTVAYGPRISRFEYEHKQHLQKRVPLGELIVLDRERCIQCGRCIRFQDEVADDPVLAFSSRGRSLEIITFSDPPFDSHFGGNTTDICPVGALTTVDFRFGARPWELTRHTSVCKHFPVGCNLTLDTRVEGHSGGWVIKRVMPRQNEQVNEIWICDKGRYGHHHARAGDRLTTPLVRKNGQLEEATWEEVLALVTRRIKAIPPEQSTGVAGDRLSNEDLFLFQALMRDVIGTPHVAVYPKAPGADLVARYGIGSDSDWDRLGQNSVILVVAGDVEEQTPIWFLRIKAAVRRGAKLITINGRATKLDRHATRQLRIRYGSAPHLLLGLTRLVLEETPVDGLQELRQNLSGFAPASTERLTGVAAKDVKAAAESLTQAEDAILVFGQEGLNEYGALALAQAAANLLVATGHVGRANNGLLPLWPHNNTQGAADMGVRPHTGPGYQHIVEHGWDFSSMLSAASQDSIKLMWLAGADPFGDDPSIAATFEPLDFMIVQELFLTDTARRADVVLPALSFAERDGTFTSGDRRVQWFNRALPALGQGRADWAILADVACRLGASWDFESAADVLAKINKTVPAYAEITLEALRATEPQWPPVGYDSLYFAGTAYQSDGGLGLRWKATAEFKDAKLAFDWIDLPTLGDSDLTAVPVRWLYRAGTLLDRSKLLKQRRLGAVAQFNPQDAERLGFEHGRLMNVSLGGQTVQLTAQINHRVPEGVVLVPSHLPAGPLTLAVAPPVNAHRPRSPADGGLIDD
jgi:NADH-quinone oxidoreductase subunit G